MLIQDGEIIFLLQKIESSIQMLKFLILKYMECLLVQLKNWYPRLSSNNTLILPSYSWAIKEAKNDLLFPDRLHLVYNQIKYNMLETICNIKQAKRKR